MTYKINGSVYVTLFVHQTTFDNNYRTYICANREIIDFLFSWCKTFFGVDTNK